MAMAGHKVEQAFLEQCIFNAAQHRRRIAFTDLRNQYAHGKSTLLAKAPRNNVRLVTEARSSLQHAPLRLFSNTMGLGPSIDDSGNRGLRKSQVSRKFLE